jgi:hypothetical protein
MPQQILIINFLEEYFKLILKFRAHQEPCQMLAFPSNSEIEFSGQELLSRLRLPMKITACVLDTKWNSEKSD